MKNVMEELLEILQEVRPDVDFASEKSLVTDRVIDSFDVMAIVTALTDEYDIKMSPADLVPENFDSAESIYALVERLQG